MPHTPLHAQLHTPCSSILACLSQEDPSPCLSCALTPFNPSPPSSPEMCIWTIIKVTVPGVVAEGDSGQGGGHQSGGGGAQPVLTLTPSSPPPSQVNSMCLAYLLIRHVAFGTLRWPGKEVQLFTDSFQPRPVALLGQAQAHHPYLTCQQGALLAGWGVGGSSCCPQSAGPLAIKQLWKG